MSTMCMSANDVAREVGYRMTGGWGEGDAATNAAFGPIGTFGERFGAWLSEVADLGFAAVDTWTAHLNPAWATPEHLEATTTELARTGLGSSLAGGFGSTPEAFEASCKVAAELGAHGCDAAAVAELADRLACVHPKDVRAARAHETCRCGEGVVPLAALGYAGGVSVEHEPEHADPAQDRISRGEAL